MSRRRKNGNATRGSRPRSRGKKPSPEVQKLRDEAREAGHICKHCGVGLVLFSQRQFQECGRCQKPEQRQSDK